MTHRAYFILLFAFCAGLPVCYLFNNEIFLAINGFHVELFGQPMLFLTSIVDAFFVLMFLVALYSKRRNEYLPALLALAVAGVIVQSIKQVFPLPRPLGIFSREQMTILGHELTQRTFPSGHAATAMVLLRYLLGKDVKGRLQISILALGTAVLSLSALSRVYIGVHFPLDIWVGAFIGFSICEMFIRMNQARFFARLSQLTVKITPGRLPPSKFWASVTYLWGMLVVVIYILFYEEKTSELSWLLSPMAVALGIWFLFKLVRVLRKKSDARKSNAAVF